MTTIPNGKIITPILNKSSSCFWLDITNLNVYLVPVWQPSEKPKRDSFNICQKQIRRGMTNFYPQTCFFTMELKALFSKHEHSQKSWKPTSLPNGTPSTTSFKFLIGMIVYTLLDLRNKILTMNWLTPFHLKWS
jgi:hypothetical protein